MHTVFIKAADMDMLLNVDKIDRIMYSENEIFAFNALEEKCSIYKGKAVNAEKALAEIVSLIHSTKMHSEGLGVSLIIDFSKDLDDPKLVQPVTRDVYGFTRVHL